MLGKNLTDFFIIFFLGISIGFIIAGSISKLEFNAQMEKNLKIFEEYKESYCNIKEPFEQLNIKFNYTGVNLFDNESDG